jgi:hypothetical protein
MEFEQRLQTQDLTRFSQHIWTRNPFELNRRFFEPFFGTDEEFQRECSMRIPIIKEFIYRGALAQAQIKEAEEIEAMSRPLPIDTNGRDINRLL